MNDNTKINITNCFNFLFILIPLYLIKLKIIIIEGAINRKPKPILKKLLALNDTNTINKPIKGKTPIKIVITIVCTVSMFIVFCSLFVHIYILQLD